MAKWTMLFFDEYVIYNSWNENNDDIWAVFILFHFWGIVKFKSWGELKKVHTSHNQMIHY